MRPKNSDDIISGTDKTQSPIEGDDSAALKDVLALTTAQSAQSGTLYVVATPIGNLRDITLRALDILNSVDEILAEDTRQSRKLLDAYNIQTPLTAFHDHNESARLPDILTGLASGRAYAQISDAGTPLVSDPGFKLARAVIEGGYPVCPLPGASSVLAALVTSGLPSNQFTFGGFLPSKSTARVNALKGFQAQTGTLLFFETGPRIAKSLKDILDVLGDRPAALARELTKKFEETRRGTVSELIDSVTQTPPRGELVVVLGPSDIPDVWDVAAIDRALLSAIPEMGVKRASTFVAEMSGWKKRDVYQRALGETH